MSFLIGSGIIKRRFIDFSLQNKFALFIGDIHESNVNDFNKIEAEELAVKKALLENTSSVFVYFSSCSILDPVGADKSPYVEHKIRMEELVKKSARKFIVFRLPQLIGHDDTHAGLINFLADAVQNQKEFEIWDKASRNIIDIDDVYDIVTEILRNNSYLNKVINIANPSCVSVIDIVNELEKIFNKKAKYKRINKGSAYNIDTDPIKEIINRININFGTNYYKNAFQKHLKHMISEPLCISIIVPTYNEENGIEEFHKRTKATMALLEPRFKHEIIFVNDASTDNTLGKLQQIAQSDKDSKILNFSRNFGNQMGITAGIDHCSGDIAVIIDDDLQDPPEIILNMISKWDQGYKVVYGTRSKRQGVNLVFKIIAKLYYRALDHMSEIYIPRDTGDFRLIDRTVIEELKAMREEGRYYRGMVAWVGFKQTGVVYERDKRYAGVSTFSFMKYARFAVNGLTSFTDKPLYFSGILGAIITLISFTFMAILIASKLIDPSISIRGWTSIATIVLFFGGVQLLSIGILGIYISKIFRGIKGRPLYILDNTETFSSLTKHEK